MPGADCLASDKLEPEGRKKMPRRNSAGHFN